MHHHIFLVMLSILITGVGQVWLAWDIYDREGLLWCLLVLLIPFPLLALWAWYRSGWCREYQPSLICYFLGYLLMFLFGAQNLLG